ncbi:MAG: polysaccharide deacetylase family protein [Xanthobacteraceae bacterium]
MDALGTERVLVVDPHEHARVGTMQYRETLPLADKEVVLTFDDAPVLPYTNHVLEALAAECVKATFFVVGRQARAFPSIVRRIYNEGHTVATHSQDHPLIFTRLPIGAARSQIDQGIKSVAAALGNPSVLAPFFRFPGLGRSLAIESYLASRGIMTWSADLLADDWTHISAQEVLSRALARLEQKGKGILLLHDIQPATALMLPQLLRELKERGYHIVQVVPAGIDRPETATEPTSWAMRKPSRSTWPATLAPPISRLDAPSAQSFGWPHPFRGQMLARMPIPPAMIDALRADAPQRLAAWSPADRGGSPTVRPISTFGVLPQLDDMSESADAGDPARPVMASSETFSSMLTPSPALAPERLHSPASTSTPHAKTRPHSVASAAVPLPAFVAHASGASKTRLAPVY